MAYLGTPHMMRMDKSMLVSHLRRAQCGDYAGVSIVELARCISESGDRDALCELHLNRPVFSSRTGRWVVISELLFELKDSALTFQWCGRDPVAVEQAYDLTLAKFYSVPPDSDDSPSADAREGPNCRWDYRAFHEQVSREFQQRPPTNIIKAEARAAQALQRMVVRHFYLSCLECRRRATKLVRRYTWKVHGGRLVLWLPVEMGGNCCRKWLRENVSDPDPERPGERDRVQAIVDRSLVRRKILSYDQLGEDDVYAGVKAAELPTLSEEISSIGLADTVAREKAEAIAEQRPAIRSLGGTKLKELIQTVFESLAQGRCNAEQIASHFGLSKATFSRFAGCQWRRDGGDTAAANIPDLWRNTAQILAKHDDFAAIAQKAGVWHHVHRIVADDGDEGRAR